MCRVFYKVKGSMKKVNILSYGVNIYSDIQGKNPGIHAEQDAMMKLPSLSNKKRPEIVDLLVVRLSKTNRIQNSKPCNNCIKLMNIIPEQKGYKIRYIYYSNQEGGLTRTSLNNLMNEEQHYSKYYRHAMNKIQEKNENINNKKFIFAKN
jgi:hypothetical protein